MQEIKYRFTKKMNLLLTKNRQSIKINLKEKFKTCVRVYVQKIRKINRTNLKDLLCIC